MNNNSDMPAMPVMDEAQEHGQHYGLTKREHFAGLAMQGILSDSARAGNVSDYARDAVLYADALLAELERTK